MFVGSIRGKSENVAAYTTIVNSLKKLNCKVVADHVLKNSQNDLSKMSRSENIVFHRKIIKNLNSCDIVVSECSHESLSVGYLLSYAIEREEKPTIVFYRSNAPQPNLFPTLSSSEKLFLVKYENLDELKKLIGQYLNYAKEQLDTRFNFFVSPTIERYLSWVAKHRKLPRSVFLRKLIEDSIAKDKAYKDESN